MEGKIIAPDLKNKVQQGLENLFSIIKSTLYKI